MPLDMVEPTILTITTEDKNSPKDEIVLQYNPDGEEKLEKLTENHDKHDYVTVDVPGMDLAMNVSANLIPGPPSPGCPPPARGRRRRGSSLPAFQTWAVNDGKDKRKIYYERSHWQGERRRDKRWI